MTEKAPVGAIVGEELRELRKKYFEGGAKSGFCAVHRLRATIEIPEGAGFDFTWEPRVAYYFRNYFLAYGYLLRLQDEKRRSG